MPKRALNETEAHGSHCRRSRSPLAILPGRGGRMRPKAIKPERTKAGCKGRPRSQSRELPIWNGGVRPQPTERARTETDHFRSKLPLNVRVYGGNVTEIE